MEPMSAFTSTGFRSSDWRREKASSRCTSDAARCADWLALSMKRSRSVVRPAATRRRITSMAPVMPWSMLLKSCAMPPVSWPMASIFWLWRRRCSDSRRAVTSRPTAWIWPEVSGTAVQEKLR